MLINHEEYQAMFEAEETLWWYRILHEKVEKQIEQLGKGKDIAILDAGCGTGGLLQFLKNKGYTNLQGFDYSESAVFFARKRGFDVKHFSIDDITQHYKPQQFDVIVNNDVVYALEKEQIKRAFQSIPSLIKPNGIFITNNNAFSLFYGTHDIAVGGKHRFTLADFTPYFSPTFQLEKYTYWSFFLSPLILLVRLAQQIQIKLGLVDTSKIESDVKIPSPWLNNFFYQLVKMEEKIFTKTPFGSSLFMCIRKK